MIFFREHDRVDEATVPRTRGFLLIFFVCSDTSQWADFAFETVQNLAILRRFAILAELSQRCASSVDNCFDRSLRALTAIPLLSQFIILST